MAEVDRLKRIVLVHGAAHGAWCWELMVPLLEQRGYAVATLDLPGLGDDPTPQHDVTLQAYIDHVVDTIQAGPTPVLLVGHSMGGMPISGAAEAVPDSIDRLVYLAAFLPIDGESLMSGGLPPDGSAMRAIRPSSVAGAHDFDRSIAPEVFYNRCTPEVAAKACARLGLQAIGPLTAPITLTPARFGRVPKTYILCTQDQAMPPAMQRYFCARAPEVKQVVMEIDHSPFFSDAHGLAEIIDREARL